VSRPRPLTAGVPPTAVGVARLYRDTCSRFVYDVSDTEEAGRIADAAATAIHLLTS